MNRDRRSKSLAHAGVERRVDSIPRDPSLPLPEVRELYGDEALAQWLAAHAMMYSDREEWAFAPTAAAPLL